MGAVTSLLFTYLNKDIDGIILDSPFSDMKQLCKELTQNFISIPMFMFGFIYNMIKSNVKSEANFCLDELSPIKLVGDCLVPALFICAKDDKFIIPSHTDSLYDKYEGDKQKIVCEGDHNTNRPRFV